MTGAEPTEGTKQVRGYAPGARYRRRGLGRDPGYCGRNAVPTSGAFRSIGFSPAGVEIEPERDGVVVVARPRRTRPGPSTTAGHLRPDVPVQRTANLRVVVVRRAEPVAPEDPSRRRRPAAAWSSPASTAGRWADCRSGRRSCRPAAGRRTTRGCRATTTFCLPVRCRRRRRCAARATASDSV